MWVIMFPVIKDHRFKAGRGYAEPILFLKTVVPYVFPVYIVFSVPDPLNEIVVIFYKK